MNKSPEQQFTKSCPHQSLQKNRPDQQFAMGLSRTQTGEAELTSYFQISKVFYQPTLLTYVGWAELLSDNINENLKNALSSTHLRGLSWTGEQPPTSAGSRLVCNHTSLQHTFLNHEYTQKINSKNRSY